MSVFSACGLLLNVDPPIVPAACATPSDSRKHNHEATKWPNQTAGTVSKITTGVRYINAVEVDATNAAADGPRVYLDRVLNGLDCAPSPRAVLARMEIEYV